jgi:thioredoxin 2
MMNTTSARLDSTHVACPACGATNRVPRARLAEDPVCGRCGAELLSGQPIELDDSSFDRFVAASGLPVVVDFWRPGAGRVGR